MITRRKPQHASTVWLTHGLIALACLLILLLAWFLPYDRELIPFCTSKRWFNFPCPFCGSTRTFAAAVKGEWAWAFQNSPMAFGLFLLTLAGLVVNLMAVMFKELWTLDKTKLPPCLNGRRVFWVIFVIVAANYAYRLMRGYV